MSGFAKVGWLGTGYSPRQVDEYFDRVQYLLEPTGGGPELRAEDVRAVKFPMVRNGYDYRAVDAALDRLELQALERERAVHYGESPPEDDTAAAGKLLARMRAPRGARFSRGNSLQRGYAVGEVDSFCDRLVATLDGGRGPGLRAVRQIEFHSQWGGYSEDEVDAVLDRVVDLLLRRMVRR